MLSRRPSSTQSQPSVNRSLEQSRTTQQHETQDLRRRQGWQTVRNWRETHLRAGGETEEGGCEVMDERVGCGEEGGCEEEMERVLG